MGQLNLHSSLSDKAIPPPTLQQELPLLIKLNGSYKIWHEYLKNLPRLTRYTLGVKVDNIFTDCLELALMGGYAARTEKLIILQKLSTKVDCLKFFLKVLWEIKALDNKEYTAISVPVGEIGKMIGGWLKLFKKETPPN